jgi:hypothetical protein
MAGWIGPTIALSLAVVALTIVGMAVAALAMIRAATARAESLEREVGELRHELTPALRALTSLTEHGTQVVDAAATEAREYLEMSRRLRGDLDRVVRRSKRRIADFEAVADVVQDEVEDTALELTTALRTVRTGAGMMGRLRRLVRPRRRR